MPSFFGWLLLWLGWVWISRFNHPSILVDAEATAIMIAGSAALFYSVKRWGARNLFAPTIALAIAASIVLTTLVVFSIQALYDIQIGPNPLRFSLMVNFALDWAFIVLNAAIAAGARRVTGAS